MKRNLLSILALTFCAIQFTFAQDAAPVTMTFDDALTSAFTNNKAIAAAQYDIDYSIHMKKAAWGYRLPQLNITGSVVLMDKHVLNLNFNDVKNQSINYLASYMQQAGLPIPAELQQVFQQLLATDMSFTLQKKQFGLVNASLTYPVYAGGKINALNRAKKVEIEQSKNDLEISKSDLFTEVSERYWGLALSKSLENLHNNVVNCITSHYNDALSLEKNGMIAKTERMYAEMSLSKAKATLAEAQNNTKVVNSALSGSTGSKGELNPTSDLFVTDSIPELGYFKAKVSENALLLNKVSNIKRLAEENVKSKRADFFPTLAIMGTAILCNYQLSDVLPRYYAGAALSLRLFDGLKTEQTYLASKSQLKKVEALQEKAESDLQILAEKLYFEMMGAKEQVVAMESSIRFAEEYYSAKNKAFKEGMATSNDVVDAELNLSKCKVERMAEAYKFDVALSKLLAMTGDWSQYSLYQMSGRKIN